MLSHFLRVASAVSSLQLGLRLFEELIRGNRFPPPPLPHPADGLPPMDPLGGTSGRGGCPTRDPILSSQRFVEKNFRRRGTQRGKKFRPSGGENFLPANLGGNSNVLPLQKLGEKCVYF